MAAQAAVNKEYLGKLAAIDPTKLGDVNAVDYDIMKLNLERGIFEAEVLREHEWNPLYYNMGGAVYSLVAREFAPIELPPRRTIESRMTRLTRSSTFVKHPMQTRCERGS